MHPFRAAIEARDLDAVTSLLADDVVFRSPIAFRPYRGPVAVRGILAAVSRVFEDFSYLREIGAPEARDHALVFLVIERRRLALSQTRVSAGYHPAVLECGAP